MLRIVCGRATPRCRPLARCRHSSVCLRLERLTRFKESPARWVEATSPWYRREAGRAQQRKRGSQCAGSRVTLAGLTVAARVRARGADDVRRPRDRRHDAKATDDNNNVDALRQRHRQGRSEPPGQRDHGFDQSTAVARHGRHRRLGRRRQERLQDGSPHDRCLAGLLPVSNWTVARPGSASRCSRLVKHGLAFRRTRRPQGRRRR